MMINQTLPCGKSDSKIASDNNFHFFSSCNNSMRTEEFCRLYHFLMKSTHFIESYIKLNFTNEKNVEEAIERRTIKMRCYLKIIMILF